MNRKDLADILSFAESRNIMQEPITNVIGKYNADRREYLDDRNADMEMMRFADDFNE